MSHRRSFERMSDDELVVKHANDMYRLKILEEGPKAARSRYGEHGTGETAFALRNLLNPRGQRHREYLRSQIHRAEKEIAQRGSNYNPSGEALAFVQTPENPATFHTYQEVRNELRADRLQTMDRSDLYFGEKIKQARKNISDGIESLAERAGTIGRTIRNNGVAIVAIGCLAASAVTGYNWHRSGKEYDTIAATYMSSPQGNISLPVKRDLAEEAEVAYFHLTQTDEITLTIDDTEVTIPEKPSSPPAARRRIHNMDTILNENFGDGNLGWVDLQPREITMIKQTRDKALDTLAAANKRLSFALDTSVSYPIEIGMIGNAVEMTRTGVNILESHMDPAVVEAENNGYKVMRRWMFGTFGLLGLGTIFGIAYAKGARNLRRRRWHYRY